MKNNCNCMELLEKTDKLENHISNFAELEHEKSFIK